MPPCAAHPSLRQEEHSLRVCVAIQTRPGSSSEERMPPQPLQTPQIATPVAQNPDPRTWPSPAAPWQSTRKRTPQSPAQKKGDVSLTLSRSTGETRLPGLVELVRPEIYLQKHKKMSLAVQFWFAAFALRICCECNFTHRDEEARRKDDHLNEKFSRAAENTLNWEKRSCSIDMRVAIRRFQAPAARRSAASTNFCTRRSRASGVW